MSGGAEWALKNRLPNTDCLALLDTRQTMVMMAKLTAPAWLSAARLRPRRWGGAESAQFAPTSVLTDAHYYLAASESSGHSSDQFVKVQVDFITGENYWTHARADDHFDTIRKCSRFLSVRDADAKMFDRTNLN